MGEVRAARGDPVHEPEPEPESAPAPEEKPGPGSFTFTGAIPVDAADRIVQISGDASRRSQHRAALHDLVVALPCPGRLLQPLNRKREAARTDRLSRTFRRVQG